MKVLKFAILLILIIPLEACHVKQTLPQIKINNPSIDHEASSIWRTINDYTFLERLNYAIHLPQDPLIDTLIEKSRRRTFGNNDYSTIRRLVEEKFFDLKNYAIALEKVKDQKQLIQKMIRELRLKKADWSWEFKMFDQYPINITLYGTGGSYDPDNGHITLFTNRDGNFMNYENPANTIIHEIVHMGIEQSIVYQYQIEHSLKERIVDNIVLLLFSKQLPNYNIQNMGDVTIDQHLKAKADLQSLDSIISKFVKQRSRDF